MKKNVRKILSSFFLFVFFLSISASSAIAATVTSSYDPNLESSLLQNGYNRNIINVNNKKALTASQKNYPKQTWSRDLDYAISGYSYVLDDMSVFKQNIEIFVSSVGQACLIYPFPQNSLAREPGVVAETVHSDTKWISHYGTTCENRQSWDSMPNLIHMMYAYVAKTGDINFYLNNSKKIIEVGNWIKALDTNNDGLPDKDIYKLGYFDSTTNGVMHTYAIAKFYAAYNELGELEQAAGRDGSSWRNMASTMKSKYHMPVQAGGYWVDGQPWPIAWKRADGSIVNTAATFGMFEAMRSGLISKEDGDHYTNMVNFLKSNITKLVEGPAPLRLAIGGFETGNSRDQNTPPWMLDASAPWIVGIAVPPMLASGNTSEGTTIMNAYQTMAQNLGGNALEFAAGANARYGAGDSGDRGRTWDNAAWFMALYGGHYGITMKPSSLTIDPHPMKNIPNDSVQKFTYQGATVQLDLKPTENAYRIKSNKAISSILLLPMGNNSVASLNGTDAKPRFLTHLDACKEYVVVSGNDGSIKSVTPDFSSYPNSTGCTAGGSNLTPSPTIPPQEFIPTTTQNQPSAPTSTVAAPPPGTTNTSNTVACVVDTKNARSKNVFYAYVTKVLKTQYTCQE